MDKWSFFLFVAVLLSCAVPKAIQERMMVDVQVDRLEKIYVLYSDNTLDITNNLGLPTYTFANNQKGRISSVDVSNPLKVLVFFKDFGIVTVLDNTLSDVASIAMNEFGYDDVRAVAGSNDNNIWIYDAAQYQLIKIDNDGNELLASINLTELELNDLNPIDIVESGNKVYVVDEEIGIVVFDNFGQYIKLLPIAGLQEVYIDREVILYQRGKELISYNPKLIKNKSVDLSEITDTSYLKVIPTPTQFVVFYPDRIERIAR